MGDGGTHGTGTSGRGSASSGRGGASSRDGGSGAGATPSRPARAEFPPTDGEIATRRLVRGHLDTRGLDPVTAKAVELLVTADALAAEQYHPAPPKPRRLWREPLWWVATSGMLAIVLIAAVMLLLVQRADEGKRSRERLERIATQNDNVLRQISSCVDPAGECAQRGQKTTSEAVAALSRATQIIVECADRYDGDDAIDACVVRRLADRR